MTCSGTAGTSIRGGWGLYTDFGFTNSNVLFPAIDVAGGHGQVFFVSNPAGIRKADGSFYTAADPISSIASQNEVDPTLAPVFGQVASPRLEQPYTRQTNFGWSHQVDSATALTVGLRPRRRPRHQHPVPPEYPHRRRAAPAGRSAHPPEHAVVPHRGQQGREHLRRPDHRAPPPDVEGLRPERVVHAQRCPQHHRHRERRARCQQHPGCGRSVRPVNIGPSSRTDARHRVSISAVDSGAVGHPGGAALPLSYRAADPHVRRASTPTTTATSTTSRRGPMHIPASTTMARRRSRRSGRARTSTAAGARRSRS